MDEFKLKVGEIVKLNSSSPMMTVCAINENDDTMTVDCVWFNGYGEIKRGGFPRECLFKLQ